MLKQILFLMLFVVSASMGQDAPSPVPETAPPASENLASPNATVVQHPKSTQLTENNFPPIPVASVGDVSAGSLAGSVNFQNVVVWIPWTVAVAMAGLAGATAVYALILRKQDRHFTALRKKVIDGSQPVHLLHEEAIQLLREFRENADGKIRLLDETITRNRKDVEGVIHVAENLSKVSNEQTHRVVDTFKTSLNETLGKIVKFMERVVQDTKESHNQALETKEIAKQVSGLIQAKEAEITKLKEGYHLHLITPLIKPFFKIREDLDRLANIAENTVLKCELGDIDRKIKAAFLDLQIEEIQVPEKPHEGFHPRYWESLGAAESTDDPSRHRTIARIHERGYQLRSPNAEPHVVQKAIVSVYSFADAKRQAVHDLSSIEQDSPNINSSKHPSEGSKKANL